MQAGKVDRQPGFMLHAQPYRESSLLIEVLTPEHGRFTLVARSARKPRSDLRGVLLPFQPLALSWFGKNELRTLHAADWQGGVPQLSGLALVCGFYLNELMMKLTARDDPEPRAYAVYDTAVRGLARAGASAAVLRRYEFQLLQALGYAPGLDVDAWGDALDAQRAYRCLGVGAPEPDEGGESGLILPGASLAAIAQDDYSQPETRRHARALLRQWLATLLGSEALASRELLQAMQAVPE